MVLAISCSLAQNCDPQFLNTFSLYSNEQIDIVDSNNKVLQKAVFVPRNLSNWVIPNAKWIWSIYQQASFPNGITTIVNFLVPFELTRLPSSVIVTSTCDDYVNVFVNGIAIPECKADFNKPPTSCNVEKLLKIGDNNIVFKAVDVGGYAAVQFSIIFNN